MFTISVAGLTIALDNRFSDVEKLSGEFITDAAPLFTVKAEDEELADELALGTGASVGTCESIVLYRKIAERLPEYDAFVFHSAVIAHGGNAYAVTARSGVGKTTHLRLWKKVLGDSVYVLNGDKPIIRKIDGAFYAVGTPWRGKEGYGTVGMLPLSGIGFLKRSENNFTEKISAETALDDFMAQIYIPKNLGAIKVLSLADELLRSIPLLRLHVNMNDDAATMAFEAFENNKNNI